MTPAASIFADLHVLDLSTRLSGAFCARLFGDFGASVVLAEPPDGHPLRFEPPLLPDGPPCDRSLVHAYLNANKRSVVLPRHEGAALTALLRWADVVITTDLPGIAAAEPGSPVDRAMAARPELVRISVTPYGLDGPMAGLPGNDLTAYALSGWAASNGDPDAPPLKGSGAQAGYLAGLDAFVGGCAAIYHHDRSGAGQLVDVSELEALAVTSGPALLVAEYAAQEQPRHKADMVRGPVPCRDGYVSLTLSRAQFWRDAMTVLELHDLAEDERYSQASFRRQQRDHYSGLVEERLQHWNRWDLFAALAARRCVAGVVLDAHDVVEDPHLAARGFFVPVKIAGRQVRFPGAPFKFSAAPWALRRPAPSLGAQSAEVAQEAAAVSPVTGIARAPVQAGSTLGGPLAGIQAVVLTQAWSGTFATELLGLLGAGVIQIEGRGRLDSWRGDFSGVRKNGLPNDGRPQQPWNTSGLFNAVNLNKRAITLDLATPRGREIFKRLATRADIVAENFTPRVMGNLGLDYAALRQLKPDIICASLSAYGATGPYANVPGIGGTIEPMSGMSSLLGYAGGRPQNSGSMYPDPVAGYYFAAAMIMALRHRDRTGDGQQIDLGMMEANATFVGDALLEYAAGLGVRGPAGNRHPRIAPHSYYPAANGRWLAIAAEDAPAWQALTVAMGRPDLASEPRFATMAARKANETALDETIAAWTGTQDAWQAATALGAAGVAAAPVCSSLELACNEQLRRRGFLVEVEHAEAGRHTQTGIPWRLSGTPAAVTRPAPGLGEHSREVLTEEAAVSPAEYEALVAAGITGDRPLD